MLDLFSGCGGLSLGFLSTGYKIIGGLESDPIAAKSYAQNFFGSASAATRVVHAKPRDITQTDPKDLAAEFGFRRAESCVDVIIGGPPCQAYARVGRAKLREVAEHPSAFLKDARRNLYLRYLQYVRDFQPIALLMENVPDALNYGGHNIAEEMCEVLDRMGYVSRYSLLNAVFYGVPQMRERMFLIAYCRQLGAEVRFPKPTHWVQLPRGYEGTRSVALKTVQPTLFGNGSNYVAAPQPTERLLPAVCAKDALEDLAKITTHLEGKLRRGARHFTELSSYRNSAKPTHYAELMRNWVGFEGGSGVVDHVIRYLPRDYRIFRRMRAGDQYPEAHEHAQQLFHEHLELLREQGKEPHPGSPEYHRLRKQFIPPYDPGKFPNKWRKMEADQPARTLMAHLGKDGYSHVHYDSDQARTISVREAARLQSFPDGFRFEGTMNPAFRQIGNAVPPLLAAAIAREMLRAMRGGSNDG
ncbi:MAG: DNA cytosine methyltransferase [Planctomycetota bacterium]